MGAILSFLAPLAKLLSGLFQYFRDSQIKQQGANEEAAKVTKEASEVEARIAEAEAKAPVTKDEVVGALERGEF